jgi:hypothetical protein
MAFEEVARVLFDDGVELFVCFGERIERVGREGEVTNGLGVGEDVEEDFWWQSIETGHVVG